MTKNWTVALRVTAIASESVLLRKIIFNKLPGHEKILPHVNLANLLPIAKFAKLRCS